MIFVTPPSAGAHSRCGPRGPERGQGSGADLVSRPGVECSSFWPICALAQISWGQSAREARAHLARYNLATWRVRAKLINQRPRGRACSPAAGPLRVMAPPTEGALRGPPSGGGGGARKWGAPGGRAGGRQKEEEDTDKRSSADKDSPRSFQTRPGRARNHRQRQRGLQVDTLNTHFNDRIIKLMATRGLGPAGRPAGQRGADWPAGGPLAGKSSVFLSPAGARLSRARAPLARAPPQRAARNDFAPAPGARCVIGGRRFARAPGKSRADHCARKLVRAQVDAEMNKFALNLGDCSRASRPAGWPTGWLAGLYTARWQARLADISIGGPSRRRRRRRRPTGLCPGGPG